MKLTYGLDLTFTTPEGRKKLIQKYGKDHGMYIGHNEHHEEVWVSIKPDSMKIRTMQFNGWIHEAYYDHNGRCEGFTYAGRWR